MDLIARELNLDPLEVRLRNALRPGDETVTGQKISHVRLTELLEQGRQRAKELDERDQAQERLKGEPRFRRAWGIGAFFMGLGRTGLADSGEVTLRLEENGCFHLFVGTPDTGQGSDTSMGQIAAQELGIPRQFIHVTSADTHFTLDAGTSTATRVTYIVGSAVKQAAAKLRATLVKAAKEKEGPDLIALQPNPVWLADLATFCRDRDFKVESVGSFTAPSGELDAEGQGNPYGAYTFGVQLSRVRVDSWTWKVDVEQIVTCFDIGRAINPLLLAGQVEGGVAMALGYGLTEEVTLQQGVITNANFDRYLLPTAADVPPITQVILESEDPEGPFGAKGIGEPSAIPGAASIANGVSAAMGVEVQELPVTPERLCALSVAKDWKD
jgi:CO/xanthine dehydrogenase Mo-binding subunit